MNNTDRAAGHLTRRGRRIFVLALEVIVVDCGGWRNVELNVGRCGLAASANDVAR